MEAPETKRAAAFFDGQNLYHHAKAAFGHQTPNYDPVKLCGAVCAANGWVNHSVRFYTGVHSAEKNPKWHRYWSNRLLLMRRAGVLVIDRRLRYYPMTEVSDNSAARPAAAVQERGFEKGIDVRLALDVVRLARGNQFDVALIFSQDQDLAEVVTDVREIAQQQNRWIKVVCAFPDSPTATAKRGLDGTDWFKMDQALYDRCLDPRDYF